MMSREICRPRGVKPVKTSVKGSWKQQPLSQNIALGGNDFQLQLSGNIVLLHALMMLNIDAIQEGLGSGERVRS
jgi:hypothetical protein